MKNRSATLLAAALASALDRIYAALRAWVRDTADPATQPPDSF